MLRQISIDDTLENYIPNICNETTEDTVDTCALRSILPSEYLLLRCIVLNVIRVRSPTAKSLPGNFFFTVQVLALRLP